MQLLGYLVLLVIKNINEILTFSEDISDRTNDEIGHVSVVIEAIIQGFETLLEELQF